eukprot:Gregarina_sp_Poly_1__2714@NODE_1749_length_3417_cov_127_736418_g1145_i0_p1_GENE_NODE_1749_length_3417_cov_127_736418_g1145_i0NODE_1749_length_3417_cov_127_736418_g1145_i0_p1_ORF_typecomplete_len527_score135_02_NODE_1749_length_3417_cov_127_736418_g1145_i012862866
MKKESPRKTAATPSPKVGTFKKKEIEAADKVGEGLPRTKAEAETSTSLKAGLPSRKNAGPEPKPVPRSQLEEATKMKKGPIKDIAKKVAGGASSALSGRKQQSDAGKRTSRKPSPNPLEGNMTSPGGIPMASVDDALAIAREATNDALMAVKAGDGDADLRMVVMKRAVKHAASEVLLHQQASETLPRLPKLETYSETLQQLHNRYPAVRRALTMPSELQASLRETNDMPSVSKIGPKAPPSKEEAGSAEEAVEDEETAAPAKKEGRKFAPARKDAEKRKRLAAKKKAFADFSATLGRRKKDEAAAEKAEAVEQAAPQAAVSGEVSGDLGDAEVKRSRSSLGDATIAPAESQKETLEVEEDENLPAPILVGTVRDPGSEKSESEDEGSPYYATSDLKQELLPLLSETSINGKTKFVMNPDILLSQRFITRKQRDELWEHMKRLPRGKVGIFLTDEEIDELGEEASQKVAMEVEDKGDGVQIVMHMRDRDVSPLTTTCLQRCSNRILAMCGTTLEPSGCRRLCSEER